MTVQERIADGVPVKLRVEHYLQLSEAGAFDEYPRVEPIDGVVVALNSQFTRHTFIKTELAFRLRLALQAIGSPFITFTDFSFKLPPFDMPDPDGYTHHRTVPLTGELRSVTLPDLAIDGAGLA